jgi:hypothetical protein
LAGLGLELVNEIVEIHYGGIKVVVSSQMKFTNITKDPLYASKYTNPVAIGLDILMLRISGVTLEKDAEYLQKRGRFGKSYGMDFFVGYPTRCIKNL